MKVARRLIFLLLVVVSEYALAQEGFSPYYVVIGGFKSEQNAQQLCNYAHENNLPALYAFNAERRIFYVYVRASQTKEVADDIRGRLRATTVFRDAWVFNGLLTGGNGTAIAMKPALPVATKAVPERKTEPPPQPLVVFEGPVEKEKEGLFVERKPEVTQSAASPQPVEAIAETPKPVGKPFVFKLVNKETGDVVGGTVRLQESDKARQFRGFNGNEKVYVPAPGNRSGKWFVLCHVLGYRQSKKAVVYDKAENVQDASIGPDEEIIIPLTLERVRRGDYVEMDGVKFFNNTALFTPGSERQLDELVAMMEENPGYEIRLHGHANGKQSRDIVSIGTSTDMFNPDLANAKRFATPKELSLLRAELAKKYLVSRGIDASRISTKGEGGAQMIFDSKGTLASLNDRVEIEIRKH